MSKRRRTVLFFAQGGGASTMVAIFYDKKALCALFVELRAKKNRCFGLWVLGRLNTKTVVTLAD